MTARRTHARRPVRLAVEPLERRDNPAEFHVYSYFPGANPSNPSEFLPGLAAVLATANTNGEDDQVFIERDIRFTVDRPAEGLLVGEAGRSIEITGSGARRTLDGAAAGRLFDVTAGDVSFANLTLTGGRYTGTGQGPTRGGAMLVESAATATLQGVLVKGNTAQAFTSFPVSGGAVYNRGTLNVYGSVFDGNQAVGFDNFIQTPGAPPATGAGETGPAGDPGRPGGSAFGGAIYAAGTTTVVGSVFTNNAAIGGRGGRGGLAGDGGPGGAGGIGGIGGAGGDGAGGAIAGHARVYSTLLGPGNAARGGAGGQGGEGGAGGTSLTGAVGASGSGGPGGGGGAGLGGAVYADGADPAAVIGNSTVSGNSAVGGSAGDGGPPGFTGTGGTGGPPGIAGTAVGAVVVGGTGTLTVASTTVANNTATGTSPLGGVVVTAGGTVNSFNSLFAGNTPGPDVTGFGALTAFGSLFQSTSFGVSSGGNVVADPALAPLADNGLAVIDAYHLMTHPIGTGSPAAGIGDPAYLTLDLIGPDPASPGSSTPTPFDGRGNVPRPTGVNPSAGSFAVAPPSTTQGDLRVSVSAADHTFTVTNAGPDDLPAAVITAVLTGGGTANFPPELPGGTATVNLPAGAFVTYSVSVTVPAGGPDGTITVTAAAGAGASDPNPSNNSASLVFPAALTAAINPSAGPADPTPDPTIRFDVDFSAPVAPFSPDLLTVTAVAPDDTALPRPQVALSPSTGPATRHFTVTVSGLTRAATVTVSLAAGTVARADFADVTNAASTSPDNAVTYAPPAPELPHVTVSVGGTPTAGQTVPVTFTVVNPDGSPATDFAGELSVTFTDALGETTATSVTVDHGSGTLPFKPVVPGPATVAAAAPGQVTAGTATVVVAPAADPNPSPLRDPVLASQESNAAVLTSGRFYNSDRQGGDEPVAVGNLIGEASVSVLHISPDHLRNYPQPKKELPGAAATAATAANLRADTPTRGGNPSVPDDIAVARSDGAVSVLLDDQLTYSGAVPGDCKQTAIDPNIGHPSYDGETGGTTSVSGFAV